MLTAISITIQAVAVYAMLGIAAATLMDIYEDPHKRLGWKELITWPYFLYLKLTN